MITLEKLIERHANHVPFFGPAEAAWALKTRPERLREGSAKRQPPWFVQVSDDDMRILGEYICSLNQYYGLDSRKRGIDYCDLFSWLASLIQNSDVGIETFDRFDSATWDRHKCDLKGSRTEKIARDAELMERSFRFREEEMAPLLSERMRARRARAYSKRARWWQLQLAEVEREWRAEEESAARQTSGNVLRAAEATL